MTYDYTDVPPSKFEPKIAEGTKATLVIHIKPGGIGEDGLLTRSKDTERYCEMLAVELTVIDGPYKGEKFPEWWVLNGTTDGHAKAKDITLRKLNGADRYEDGHALFLRCRRVEGPLGCGGAA